jgi:hypothetical protein
MNVNKLCKQLNREPWDAEVYLQVGFNRFPISDIQLTDEGYVLIHTTLDADNPPKPTKPLDAA